MKRFLQLAFLAAFLAPTAALAHTGVGDTSGFMHGFMHPLGGLDHQLAMILVGIFAYQLGGRALWLVPLTFVGVMAIGGLLGVAGIPVPFIELGIALSVIVLGAIVAFGVKVPVAAAMGIVGLFAIFHGHAHQAGSYRWREYDVFRPGSPKHSSHEVIAVRIRGDEVAVAYRDFDRSAWTKTQVALIPPVGERAREAVTAPR